MNRIAAIAFICLNTLPINAEQQRGKVIINHSDNAQILFQHRPKTSQEPSENPEHYLTRKKKNTAAIILNGLAQVCSQVCNLIAGKDGKDKQQAVLGIVGTTLNVTAQLTEKTDKDNQDPTSVQTKSDPTRALSYDLASLTTTLLNALDEQPTKTILPSTLVLLKSVPEEEIRAEVIKLMLSTPANAYQFLHDLFLTAHHYFSTNDGEA